MSLAPARARWVDEMRTAHVLEVAQALGLACTGPKHASGGAFAPCPACSRQGRHEKRGDNRLSCGVRSRGNGWHCFACDVTGDALHLVAMHLTGARFGELTAPQRQKVRAWCESFLRLPTTTPAAPRHLAIVRAAPVYPPQAEVEALWAACVPVASDPAISRWLRDARSLDPVALDAHELARALPRGAVTPPWARTGEHGHAWSATGFRLVFPLYDATGTMRSLLARNARADAIRKTSAALGFARSGLVLADRAALSMLRGHIDPMFPGDRVIVVAEGEMDLTAWSLHGHHGDGVRSANLGIFSGSWTPELAARIPAGSRVVIAVDGDKAGAAYQRTITESLRNRRDVTIARWT